MVDHKKLRELAYSPDLLNAYCNVPATVIALLDEIDALKAANRDLQLHFDAAILDAKRYQEVRTGRRWSVINAIGDELKAEALDSCVDAILSLSVKRICNRCGGEMKPGQALESTLVGEPDDLGGVVTVSPGGPGKLVPCMKCAECGWSVTVGESKRTRRDKREPWPDGDDES